MMSIFQSRNPQRDRETDGERLGRLSKLLGALVEEMTSEREGLEARQRKWTDQAAFSELALENDIDASMSAKVDGLTASIVAAADRLRSLQDQIAFLRLLSDEIVAFEKGL